MGESNLIGIEVTNTNKEKGTIVEIDDDIVAVNFNGLIKRYEYPKSFNKFLFSDNPQFLTIANKFKEEEAAQEAKRQEELTATLRSVEPLHLNNNSLLGERGESIHFVDDADMWLCYGYIASGKHATNITAEVPESKIEIFESVFKGQPYSVIKYKVNNNLPTKFAVQFRISFQNTTNCPQSLLAVMKYSKNGTSKINRSHFVDSLVKIYGFNFGSNQNINKIKEIAKRYNHLDDFVKGLNL